MTGPAAIPDPARPERPGRRRAGGRTRPAALAALAGQSAAWACTLECAAHHAGNRLPLLVAGEAGVGKRTLVAAMHAADQAAGRVQVFDAALTLLDDPGRRLPWLRRVRRCLRTRGGAAVFRNLDLVDPCLARLLDSILDEIPPAGPRLVATLTTDGLTGRGGSLPALLAGRFAARVDIPPLRLRPEDLPDLLERLTRRHAPGSLTPRWTAEAVRALTRLAWPGNIRELDGVVRRTLSRRSVGEIGVQHLPVDVQEASAGRQPVGLLEIAERAALLTALQQEAGRQRQAELLGVTRQTVLTKVHEWGLEGVGPRPATARGPRGSPATAGILGNGRRRQAWRKELDDATRQ